MKDIIKNLREWRSDRNLSNSSYKTYFENIIEELLEPMYSKKDVKYLKDEIVERYFNDVELDNDAIIDTINDISVFSINENELMGYNYCDCMNETIKEISSREQDPQQRNDWLINGVNGKWMKDTNQDESTLYKANYNKSGIV